MLKDRLYYIDPYQRAFAAKLVREAEDGNGCYAVLENTAFYPTGGGQPHDTGALNGVRVTNVETVDGEIRHYIEESLGGAESIEGIIDWDRRFDHMQQHLGQHLLTAAFVELFGADTVSFHLGQELSTIDLDAGELSAAMLDDAEELANRVILENRPVETKWVTEAELTEYDLRKPVSAKEEIRLVIVPDFDDNGCGGTHPSSTGEVAAIKIIGTEKQKRNVRVHFVCGGRVLKQLGKKTAILQEATKRLSAPEEEVPLAVSKLVEANKGLEKELASLEEELLGHEAKELAGHAADGIAKASFASRSVQSLQKLARLAAAERADLTVLLAVENGDKLQFAAAAGGESLADLKSLAAAILPSINGKGGGSKSFVQGGGEKTMPASELLGKMEEVCKKQG